MGKNKQKKDNNLRSYQIMIKPEHRLFEYSNKEVKKPNEFKVLSKEAPFLSYELLEGLFKLIDHDDYRALPSHSNQLIMKKAFGDRDSFFCALREYNIRVIPGLGVYMVEVVLCLPEGKANNMSLVPDRIAGIDL